MLPDIQIDLWANRQLDDFHIKPRWVHRFRRTFPWLPTWHFFSLPYKPESAPGTFLSSP
jgi:hypothetical protein